MAKNKLEYLKEEYENKPKDTNLLRYISCLIYYRNYEEALDLLEKVTDTTKMDVVSLYRAKIYRFQNDEEKFMENINILLASGINYEAYLELAEYNLTKIINLKNKIKAKELERTLEIKEEIKVLNNIVKSYLEKSLKINKTGNALLRYAELEFFDGNYSEAKKYFKEILESKDLKIQLKDLYYVRLRLATIYVNDKNFDEAEELIDKILIDKYSNKSKVFLLKAQILMKKGELIEAQKFYKQGLGLSASPKDHLEYAKLCINLSENNEALEHLEKVKATNLKNRAIQEEARLKVNLGKYDEGIKLYQEMLKGNNKDKNIAYIGIGTIYRIKGESPKAIEWLNKALEGNEYDKVIASIELAKVYEDLNDFSIAQKLLEEVINNTDGNYGRVEYAKLLLKTHDNKQAKEILLDIIQNSSNKIDKQESIMTLAILEKSLGNLVEARNYLKELLNLKSKIYYKAICIEIECNIELNEFDLARKNIEILKKSESKIDNEKIIYYEAEILRLEGKKVCAEEKYLKLIESDSFNILALNGLANLYKDTNDYRFFDITNKLRNMSKNNEPMADYLEATYYFQFGEFKKAAELLKMNINNTNDYTENSIILCANIEELCDNYTKAISFYNRINDKKSKYYNKAIFRTAKIYLKIGDLEKSEQYFKQIIDSNGPYKNLSEINLAVIFNEKKEYDKAEEILTKFDSTKHEGSAKLELAKMKVKQNKLDEACVILESILNTSSRFHAMLELVKIKEKQNEYYEAFTYVNNLIDENNGHLKQIANLEKARIYALIGEYQKAKNIYIDILLDNSNDNFDINEELEECKYDSRFKNNILLDLGQVEKSLGNLDEAINYFLQVNTKREKAYAYCELIDIEIDRKNFEKALEYIKEVEDSLLADKIKTKKMSIYLELGKYDEIHEIAKEITSDDYKLMAIYKDALAYFAEENFENAKELFLTLINNENEFRTLAQIYLGKISIIEKNLDSARYYFNLIEDNNGSTLRQKMFIDIKENKYYDALQKAITLFNASNSINEKENDSIIISYLSSELNVILPSKYYGKINDIKSNMLFYDKDNAYNYLITKSINDNVFNPCVDFNLLLDIIETNLDENHFTRNSGYDEYVFDFENIGINGEDYLKVCTLPNTKNIIAMYPIKSRYDFHSEYVRKKVRNES